MSLGPVFDDQYVKRVWDAEAGSGPGSMPQFCKPYICFVRLMLNNGGPWSVIDWGCGDARVAEAILAGSPRGTKYCLYDVSQVALEKAGQRLGRHWKDYTLEFKSEPPVVQARHIVLVKDVLMHLSRAEINKLLQQVSPASVLVFCHDDPMSWPPIDRQKIPRDIECGGYRPLSLAMEGSVPYFKFTFESYCVLKCVEVFRYGEGLQQLNP